MPMMPLHATVAAPDEGPGSQLQASKQSPAVRDVLLLANARREMQSAAGSESCLCLANARQVEVAGDWTEVATMSVIGQRKRIEAGRQLRAFHDELTGLPGRSLMKARIDGLIATSAADTRFAIALLNIDDFKPINDVYSQALGDALLLSLSGRIRNVIQPVNDLARISSDKLLLLLTDIGSDAVVHQIIDRVVDELHKPHLLDSHEIFSPVSVGVCLYPDHGADYESLQRSAETALRQAKSVNTGSVAFFDDAMKTAQAARMEIEQKLRNALKEHRFRAAYQPKLDIRTDRIVGFEALARWVEPDGRVFYPSAFIGVATELGLLGWVTHNMLEEIVADLPRLRRQFGPDIVVSINIAAVQANSPDFMRHLAQRIKESNLGSNLIVELTEDAAVQTHSLQKGVLPELRDLGVRVSIDDFGTGFSSLSLLSDIDADELKVDRAFIMSIDERPRSQSILRAIESVCRALNIAIVAEGVERQGEYDYLLERTGIRVIQGFYIGEPAFIENLFEKWPCEKSNQAHS